MIVEFAKQLNEEEGMSIQEAAVEAGMATLRENGLKAVFDGSTSVEELLRETIE